MDVRVIQGEIAAQSADALVSSDRTNLRMATGVAGAIRRAADGPINREAAAQGPLELGEVLATDAFGLDADHVIHAAAMPHFGGGGATEESIREATLGSLETAEERGCETLVIPVLGTRMGEFPFEAAARILVETIAGFEGATLAEVRVIASGETEYETLQDVAAQVASR